MAVGQTHHVNTNEHSSIWFASGPPPFLPSTRRSTTMQSKILGSLQQTIAVDFVAVWLLLHLKTFTITELIARISQLSHRARDTSSCYSVEKINRKLTRFTVSHSSVSLPIASRPHTKQIKKLQPASDNCYPQSSILSSIHDLFMFPDMTQLGRHHPLVTKSRRKETPRYSWGVVLLLPLLLKPSYLLVLPCGHRRRRR